MLNEIIGKLQAIPRLWYLCFEIDDNQLTIYGNYEEITTISGAKNGVCAVGYYAYPSKRFTTNQILECMEFLISMIDDEYVSKYDASGLKYYKENFPCLAAEVDYSEYEEYHTALTLAAKTGQIYKDLARLAHFDWLALWRKLRAAFDGHPLPWPIKEAIMEAFGFPAAAI